MTRLGARKSLQPGVRRSEAQPKPAEPLSDPTAEALCLRVLSSLPVYAGSAIAFRVCRVCKNGWNDGDDL